MIKYAGGLGSPSWQSRVKILQLRGELRLEYDGWGHEGGAGGVVLLEQRDIWCVSQRVQKN